MSFLCGTKQNKTKRNKNNPSINEIFCLYETFQKMIIYVTKHTLTLGMTFMLVEGLRSRLSDQFLKQTTKKVLTPYGVRVYIWCQISIHLHYLVSVLIDFAHVPHLDRRKSKKERRWSD